MLYVILLLVVVGAVVALVLKKRNAEKQTPAKPIAKKSTTNTKLVEEPVISKKQTTPLVSELRRKIETLIQEQNLFAAEAQINQALNRDNSQHELYLLLLDIHILQKDEFAIDQLISHIRSLDLDDILAEAEKKKAAYQAKNKADDANSKNQAGHDAIEFHKDDVAISYKETPAPAAPPVLEKTTDFDQLVTQPVVSKEEQKPLNFDFSDTTPVAEKAEPVATPEPVVSPEPAVFEFESFSFESEKKTETPVKVEASPVSAPTLEFDTTALQLETEEKVSPAPEIKALDLDFTGIDTATTPSTEEPKKLDLDLDFSFTPTGSDATPVVEAEPVTKLEPSLDFNFNTEVAPEPVSKTVAVETPVSAAPNLDFNLLGESTEVAAPISAPEVETINSNDPLVQSFPELVEVSEISLNLDLAKQYIQLGAFEAARELLDESEGQLSSEQQQHAQALRNQIA